MTINMHSLVSSITKFAETRNTVVKT